MKQFIFFLTGIFLPVLSLSGQLNTLHNHYRTGDVLVKQQVEFAGTGEAGSGQLWDFSKLKTINNEYTLTYSQPPIEGDSVYILGDRRYRKKDVKDNELIVGTEHNTMYYYHLCDDSLVLIGHENPSVVLGYTSPVVQMRFPLNYGQAVTSTYKSEGLYSGTVAIQTKGTITTTADAYGKMILPSGDTLSPVLRVKTIQTIFDMPGEGIVIEGENSGKQMETCRWYGKGYRYPVFETIRSINLSDDTEIFSTAFFYPPQDHLYLNTDPNNQALLDELWEPTEENNQDTADSQQTGKTVRIDDLITCKIYPNPVESVMSLEYELKENAKVSFEMYSLDGMPIKKTAPKTQAKGIYYETINCSGLYPNNYVLRITINNLTVNEIIIKK